MTAIYAIFLLSAFLMLIGLFGRIAAAVTAMSAVYLISFLFLYGKVDHTYHHLVFFAVVCAVFPSTDTLSIDAAWAAWRDADTGRLRRSQPSLAYGYAMQSMWFFVGLAYYFPGLWKIQPRVDSLAVWKEPARFHRTGRRMVYPGRRCRSGCSSVQH